MQVPGQASMMRASRSCQINLMRLKDDSRQCQRYRHARPCTLGIFCVVAHLPLALRHGSTRCEDDASGENPQTRFFASLCLSFCSTSNPAGMSATFSDVVKLHARCAGLLFLLSPSLSGFKCNAVPLVQTRLYITQQLVGSATDKAFDDCCSHFGAPWSVARVADRAIQDARDKAQAGTWRFSDRQEEAVVVAFSAV